MTLKHSRKDKTRRAVDSASKKALSEQANIKQQLMQKMTDAFSDEEMNGGFFYCFLTFFFFLFFSLDYYYYR
jgi:hypothetical protein